MKNSHTKKWDLVFDFGPFRLDPSDRTLKRGDIYLPLAPKVFITLMALVENSGRVVEKDDLLQQISPDAIVEENVVSQYVCAIRKLLDDNERPYRYIETVAKRGYRFKAPVSKSDVAHLDPSLDEVGYSLPRGRWDQKLRWAIAGMTFLLTVIAISTFLRWNERKPVLRTLAGVISTAENTDQNRYASIAFASEILDELAQSGHFTAISISSAYYLSGDEASHSDILKQLGADALLTVSASQVGNRWSVNIGVRSDGGDPLWSGRFEHATDELDTLRSEVIAATRTAMAQFTEQKTALAQTRGKRADLRAVAAYHEGRYLWNTRRPEDLHRSIIALERATTLDPTYVNAHIALAEAYAFDFVLWPKAEQAAMRAIELDPQRGEPYAALGFLKMFWGWDWDGADELFRKAVALSPGYAQGHQWYASLLAARGRKLEAIEAIKRARAIDPLSPAIGADMGQVLYYNGDYTGAIQVCSAIRDLHPDLRSARACLYQAYLQSGMNDLAVSEYFEMERIAGHDVRSYGQSSSELKAAYSTGGIEGFISKKLELYRYMKTAMPAWSAAEHFARSGSYKEALRWLRNAYDVRDADFVFTLVEPAFIPLHGDPEFDRLLELSGLIAAKASQSNDNAPVLNDIENQNSAISQ